MTRRIFALFRFQNAEGGYSRPKSSLEPKLKDRSVMRLRILFVAMAAVLLTIDAAPRGAQADIVVDVNQATIQPLPIAILRLRRASAGRRSPLRSSRRTCNARAILSRSIRRPLAARRTSRSLTCSRATTTRRRRSTPRSLVERAPVDEGQPTGSLRVAFYTPVRRPRRAEAARHLDQVYTATPENWRPASRTRSPTTSIEQLTGQKTAPSARDRVRRRGRPRGHRVKRLTIMDQDEAVIRDTSRQRRFPGR